jgi:acyl-CoA carboxylase epsilon subunit
VSDSVGDSVSDSVGDSPEPGQTGPEREPGQAEEATPEQRRALFRVVRGEPDDIEVAALAVVLAAAAAAGSAADSGGTRRTSVWMDRQAMLRQQLHPGPGAWRNSTLPR